MSHKIQDNTKISVYTTVEEWKALRTVLLQDINQLPQKEWKKTYEIFYQRIQTRFLNPIESILEKKSNTGEGFAVVAIQCILIEFLEAFYQGKTYTTKHKNLWAHEYTSSKQLFKDFLLGHEPFQNFFTDKLANKFYSNIRCGLLHEAQTKETSKIRAHSKELLIKELDNDNMVIYRTNFHQAILDYIENYKQKLSQDAEVRRNFIRKMDELCGIEHVYYFAYGSNMKWERLLQRLDQNEYPARVHSYSRMRLENYRFTFNKKGKDGTSKANIYEQENEEVWGICYEVDKSAIDILNHYEKGYNQEYVTLEDSDGKKIRAIAYKSESIFSHPQAPSDDYYNIVIEGATAQKLPESYISKYIKR